MSFSGRLFTMAAAASSTVAFASSEEQECSSITHFIFLVHGWMGNAQEMKYMEQSLEREASKHPSQRFIIVSPTVNEGKTHDGIAAGGDRLATAVTELMDSYQNANNGMTTVSFVGNSLGGLYSRYAISKMNFDRVQPMVFCTTATPHLGVSKHTYIPLPRWGEYLVAHALQPTGKDLFSVTPLIEEMAFEPQYREPLQNFHRRIAYANAFATDFQVPTSTAAFLCPQSPHPHVTVRHNDEYFALTVETPRDPNTTAYTTMAHALDQMGWTKVFCDNRDNIPLPAMPLLFTSETNIPRKQEYTSKELIPLVTSVGKRYNFPLGHQVLVANSKSGWYTSMSAGGRPVVDRMAASLIDDIVNYTNDFVKGKTQKEVLQVESTTSTSNGAP